MIFCVVLYCCTVIFYYLVNIYCGQVSVSRVLFSNYMLLSIVVFYCMICEGLYCITCFLSDCLSVRMYVCMFVNALRKNDCGKFKDNHGY